MGNCPCERFKDEIEESSFYENIESSIVTIKKDKGKLVLLNRKIKEFNFLPRESNQKILISSTTTKTLSSQSTSTTLPKSVVNQNTFHIVIYGPTKSGKTTFALKINNQKVTNYYIPSIYTEKYKVPITVKDKTFDLIITIPKPSEQTVFLDADCYYIFFDLTDSNSLNEIKNKIVPMLQHALKPIFLIGNKNDQKIFVQKIEIDNLCQKLKCRYFEISSLKGMGILKLIKKTKRKLVKRRKL